MKRILLIILISITEGIKSLSKEYEKEKTDFGTPCFFIQMRELFYDDKGGGFAIRIDLLIGAKSTITAEIIKNKLDMIAGHGMLNVDIETKQENFLSDHFAPNHREYYGFPS